MNSCANAVQAISGQVATQFRDVSATVIPRRWIIYLGCTLCTLACNYILGKDMAWDTLNYHLYLGFSAVNDRFGLDYFAAGPMAYLNPYAYVPFYAMVHAGWPALGICSVFAAIHSVILWLSFEIGVAVCPSTDGRTRAFAGSCAAALAFINPILMQQIGSCFADITTAELALAGWLLLANAVRHPRMPMIVYSGLILGAATALKLSNSLAAISAFVMLAFLPLDWRGRIRQSAVFGLSLGMGFSVVAAPWSWRLEKAFGNPMFPMFNNIFRSPEFTTESMGNAYRFIPDSIGDALWRPFEMIKPEQMVHEELSAPDPRYAILIVLVVALIFRWGRRRLHHSPNSSGNSRMDDSTRVLAALGGGLILYWILWLHISGNSRYVLTMACIAAAVIVGLLFRLFESHPKVRNYILGLILLTQAVQLSMGAEYRWNGVPWGGPWFNISIPKELSAQPNLYLTLGTQSNSFLAPFLAKGSAMSNVVGGYTLDPDSENGRKVKALIRKFMPNVRAMFLTNELSASDGRRIPRLQVDDALSGFGLRPDMGNCAIIAVHGLPPALEIRFKTSLPQEPLNRDTTFVAACRVKPDLTDRSALVARRRAVDLVFDRLEDSCPKLFQPRRLVTVHFGNAWRRLYGATDIVAWISNGRVKFSDQIRPSGVVDLGSESDWMKAPMRLDCGRRDGVYFAHVLQPGK